MKKLVLMFVLCFTTLVIYTGTAKADDYSDAMMDAKKDFTSAMNTMNKSDVLKVRGQFERILQLQKDEWLVNYYVALCDYMLSLTEMSGGGEMTKDAKKNLQTYTESGLEIIGGVIQKKNDFADAYVLKKFLNFNRWTYEQDKMNDIIAVDQEANTKADKYGSNNPRYFLGVGISAYWTPPSFGGGASRAIEMLDISAELFATTKPENELYPEWGNDWALGYKVLALLKRDDDGDKENAKKILDDAMQKFPDSSFLSSYIKEEYEKSGK